MFRPYRAIIRLYKITVLYKVQAVVLPAGTRGLQFNIYQNINCDKIDIKYRYDSITHLRFSCACVRARARVCVACGRVVVHHMD